MVVNPQDHKVLLNLDMVHKEWGSLEVLLLQWVGRDPWEHQGLLQEHSQIFTALTQWVVHQQHQVCTRACPHLLSLDSKVCLHHPCKECFLQLLMEVFNHPLEVPRYQELEQVPPQDLQGHHP